MKKIINSLEEMNSFSKEILNTLQASQKACVLGLRGDLGSGKTTFTQFFAKNLGIADDITSPTFVILKRYEAKNSNFKYLVHVDAYRLESAKEMEVLNFKEYLESIENLVVIEWAERIKETLPADTKFIDFKFVDEKTREAEF